MGPQARKGTSCMVSSEKAVIIVSRPHAHARERY
jgi:hypothetical protein